MARRVMGRLAAYASGAAEMGVTVAVGFPCSRTSTTTPAAIRMTAAATAKGSQLRSRVSAGRTCSRSGRVLTSGFYTRYRRNTPAFRVLLDRRRILRHRDDMQGSVTILSGVPQFFEHRRRANGV